MQVLLLDFPVLTQDNLNFNDDVEYAVELKKDRNQFYIHHTLKGLSFIREFFLENKAFFTTTVYYEDNRQRFSKKTSKDQGAEIDLTGQNSILVKQPILKRNQSLDSPTFSCSITLISDQNESLKINSNSGLRNLDAWRNEEGKIIIPNYAKIATFPTFTMPHMSPLIEIIPQEDFDDGTYEVIVQGKPNTPPVEVACAQDVATFLEPLKIRTQDPPQNWEDSVRLSILTNILQAVYSEIKMRQISEEDGMRENIHLILRRHLEKVSEETQQDYTSDDFSPTLAATKMQPIIIKNYADN